jgi:hypothetical protein
MLPFLSYKKNGQIKKFDSFSSAHAYWLTSLCGFEESYIIFDAIQAASIIQ